MKKRIVRSIVIILGSLWLGLGLFLTGLTESSVELSIAGMAVLFVGVTVAYLHLTYRDDDDKFW